MKNLWIIDWIVCLVLFLPVAACSPRVLDKPYPEARMERVYTDGVGDAAKPQPWEVSPTLLEITDTSPGLLRRVVDGEEYVLVSTWKNDTALYFNDAATQRYNTQTFPIWVTAAPELQQRCRAKNFGRKEGVDLRLKQLLGLPPTVSKRYFVEFWVRPRDLYRPCPDPEITDRQCETAFPDSVSQEHKTWINNQRLASYFNAQWDWNYPWTELGYTYDWNPRSRGHVGLSEFIIGNNKEIIVEGVQTTAEYCGLEHEHRRLPRAYYR